MHSLIGTLTLQNTPETHFTVEMEIGDKNENEIIVALSSHSTIIQITNGSDRIVPEYFQYTYSHAVMHKKTLSYFEFEDSVPFQNEQK